METAVVIVEDSEMSLRRLQAAVDEVPGLRIVGTAPGPREAIELISVLRPAIMVLDLFLLGGSGVDVLKAIREQGLGTHVVVVTNAPSRALGETCRNLGARYFLDKTFEFEQFQQALQTLQAEAAQAI